MLASVVFRLTLSRYTTVPTMVGHVTHKRKSGQTHVEVGLLEENFHLLAFSRTSSGLHTRTVVSTASLSSSKTLLIAEGFIPAVQR